MKIDTSDPAFYSDENREKLIDDAVTKAIILVEKKCGCFHGERPWNEATVESKHGKKEYRIKLLVLDGSPPKGHIVVEYAHGIVRAFGANTKPLMSYKAFPDGSSLRAL